MPFFYAIGIAIALVATAPVSLPPILACLALLYIPYGILTVLVAALWLAPDGFTTAPNVVQAQCMLAAGIIHWAALLLTVPLRASVAKNARISARKLAALERTNDLSKYLVTSELRAQVDSAEMSEWTLKLVNYGLIFLPIPALIFAAWIAGKPD